jgi:4-amino-4-deoxy-L-arabinose transferase-like glycosyltransferase
MLADAPFLLPLVVGLILRLAVVPPRMELDVAPLIADEGNYWGIAQALADGIGIPDRWVWLRPPGYPLVLAGLIRLFGRDLHAPLVLQALAGTLTVAAVALLSGRLWGRRAAFIAACWAALNPSLIYYTRILHTEVLYTTCITFAALGLAWYARPGAALRPLALSAILVGLAALLRPAIIAPLPFVVAWLVLRRPRGERRLALGHAALFIALCAAVIAPNALHNWLAYRRFIPLDTTLGYIFWLDHRDVTREEIISTLAAIRNPGDRQQYALNHGLAWVAAHPWETVRISVGNLRVFWGEPPYVVDAIEKRRGVAGGWRAVANSLTLLTWLITVSLAIVAFVRARHRDPLIPLVLIAVLGPTLGVALSHHENRYLIPSVALLIPLAAGVFAPRPPPLPETVIPREGVIGANSRDFWQSHGLSVVAGALVALFLLNAGQIGVPLARQRGMVAAHWLLAQVAERRDGRSIAQRQYDAMLAWDPRLSEPDERRALLDHARGDDDAAIADASRALDRDPDNFRARAFVAALLRDRGQLDDARRFARAKTIAPEALAWAWDHPTAPPPARVVLDGTDFGFARGFYSPEQGEGDRPFRWMSGHAQFRLAPPAPGTPAVLILVLASPRPPDAPPVDVRVAVNGRTIGHATVRRELGWNEIRLSLPSDLDPGQPLLIDLQTTTIQQPDDLRAFGVAVSSVGVEGAP